MSEISFTEILDAREARAARRAGFQAAYPGTCLSLSLNVPGAVKDSPRIRRLFQHAAERIARLFSLVASRTEHGAVGPHGLFAVSEDAAKAKELACLLEAEGLYGRLLDIDVYAAEGKAVASPGRGGGRSCFLCGDSAVACMRAARHSREELQAWVNKAFLSFEAEKSREISPAAAYYASLALEALLFEVASCPSPGLVDPLHNGSHKDMNFFTFLRSSAALADGLARCAEAGIRHVGEPQALLPLLRFIGMEAEEAMFKATSGVNTQKGLLFSMGLSLGAAGILHASGRAVQPDTVCAMLSQMARGLVERELGSRHGPARTVGEKVFREYGISGIRGEVEAGLPSVLGKALPVLRQALARGEDCNRALLRTLVALMAVVDDTTILARSPELDSLRRVQRQAGDLEISGQLDAEGWREALWAMDNAFVAENLSPGGSADLLAVTWFLHRLSGGGHTAE